MRLISTGIQLSLAVKNVQRLRHIIAVLAKYGFIDLIQRMHLGKLMPSKLAAFAKAHADTPIPERLRLSFEELGPTFVKLGQLLSTRPDLLPETYIEEFTKLQDNVAPLPFEIIKSTVEFELKKPLHEIFAFFDPIPLASASIAQAHEARLNTGEKVVVKVQRPEIKKTIETDISLLNFLAGLLEKYVPETHVVGPKVVVNEFFRTLSFELNFVTEANNTQKMAENLASFQEIVIPNVYKESSTQKVLVLQKLEGIRINNIQAIDAAGVDKKRIVEAGARAFFKSVMIDGLFHGDMHGGNLFVLPGNKLGMIDFGIVGRLSRRGRDQLANIVMSIMSEDYENLCYQYAELSSAGPSVDFDAFQRDVSNVISPYMGLSLGEINVGRVLIESTKLATKYNIKVPGEWMLVFKAIFTIEGIGRSLNPNFDLLAIGHELVKDLVKNQYSLQRVSKDLTWVAKDLSILLQTLPRQIKWMFRKFNSNDFAFEIKSNDFREIRSQLDRNGKRSSLSIITAGLFVAGSLALHDTSTAYKIAGLPFISIFLFAIGSFFLVQLVFRLFR
ncbi:MAG: AarF/UbiB family protein [Bdellovibrionota bacterium]